LPTESYSAYGSLQVTELVDVVAIESVANEKMIDQNLSIPSQVIEKVSAIIRRKDSGMVKDGP